MKAFTKLLFLSCVLSLWSQNRDLTKLAKGEYLGFNAVFNQQQELFGYLAVYGYGKSGEKTKKFEYVILDKNLNPIANKEFEGDITAANYYAYMDFKGKIILKPSQIDYYAIKEKELFAPSSMEINLKENTIQRKIYYDYQEDGTFLEIIEPKNWKQLQKEEKSEKRKKGYNFMSGVYEIKEGGYLVIEYKDYDKYINDNSLIKFDDSKKETWRFNYNTSGDKKKSEELTVIEKDEKNIYCIMQYNYKDEKSFALLVIDMKTGKEVHKKPVTTLSNETLSSITRLYGNNGLLDNDKVFDDKIVIAGWDRSGPNYYDRLGLARLVINKISFEVTENKILFDGEFFKTNLPGIKKNGTLEKGFDFEPKDVFFMKDGSVGYLMEKVKTASSGAIKTENLVYIYTDKDFNAKGIKIFEKERSYSTSNYLFSQYINNDNDVIFFYRAQKKEENSKEKNWMLFINRLVNGEFEQEEVKISEKNNYFVFPYPAKNGYVLLQEFNKKQKFNQIYLEQLSH